jgi:hypothetical protein
VFGDFKSIGRVRIEHDLQQARPVAQVDEDYAAVIAAAMLSAATTPTLAAPGQVRWCSAIGSILTETRAPPPSGESRRDPA